MPSPRMGAPQGCFAKGQTVPPINRHNQGEGSHDGTHRKDRFHLHLKSTVYNSYKVFNCAQRYRKLDCTC